VAKFDSVEDFLNSLPSPKQETLRAVLNSVLTQFPEAEFKLAWNVPHAQIQGKYVLGVNAFKNHLALAPWSETLVQDFADRLAGYETTQRLIRIPVDWEVDQDLIRDIINARLAELGLS
jgi:uncharacterized protein YdhG (YjbR/CyaY superfamily)